MLESIYAGGLTLQALLICSALSIILGLVVAFVHTRTAGYTKNFAITLVVLPILVQAVMMMVNGNIGTGIAILGAFSLVRFRSIPGTSREIVSVFFAMAIGLATGTGYVGFAVFAAIVVALLLLVLTKTRLFEPTTDTKKLKVTMPEDHDFDELLRPIFAKHAVTAEIDRIKTKDMGSLYELVYDVTLPATMNRKTLIDDIRTVNNNLSILLTEKAGEGGL